MSSTDPTAAPAAPILRHQSSSTVVSSGVSSYSPTSTLERQYETKRRILLAVQLRANLAGGVEYILQQQVSSGSEVTEAPLVATPQSPLESNTSTSSAAAPTEERGSGDSDPFAFLKDDATTVTSSTVASSTTPTNNSRTARLGGFLKKVTQTASQKLERGMQHLAIRADQGRNPDLVCVGVYDTKTEELLCLTESLANGPELTFTVPLTVAVDSIETQQLVSIKVWIRSGATLLQQTKQAKNYLLGSAVIQMDQLVAALDQKCQEQPPKNYLIWKGLSLQSTWVVDGHVDLVCFTDPKHPTLCGLGWSLVDPVTTCYTNGSHRFNQPLDQSYVFPNDSNSQLFFASERCTESTVTLPLATAIAQHTAAASHVSLTHAQHVQSTVLHSRHDVARHEDEHAIATLHITPYLAVTEGTVAAQLASNTATVQLSWQRPDSIFESDLVAPFRIGMVGPGVTPPASMTSPLTPPVVFYPKPCRENVLPSVQQQQPLPAHGFRLGVLRVALAVPMQPGQAGQEPVDHVWDCLIGLDNVLASTDLGATPPTNPAAPQDYPVMTATGQTVGTIRLQVTVTAPAGQQPTPTPAPSHQPGLASWVGLPRVVPDLVSPDLDYVHIPTPTDEAAQRRRAQLVTLGDFCTTQFLDYHVGTMRATDARNLQDRATQYRQQLEQATPVVDPHETKVPKCFRPSSSRKETLLSGLPFNLHAATWSVQSIPLEESAEPQQQGAWFQNMSGGAAADHARGFGSLFANDSAGLFASPVGTVSGGLRRLEAKRVEIGQLVVNLQTTLTLTLTNYFTSLRQQRVSAASHVPTRHTELAQVRAQLCQAVQALHHVTWHCAVRRASCFSQALCTAVSSYLTSLSQPTHWPQVWAQHGYLVGFEGLLSAAGSELGMIEDAYVGISMLRAVSVVLAPAKENEMPPNAVPVPDSPYLKWIVLSTTAATAPAPEQTQYTVQIGVIESYYQQRVPQCLQNNAPVRLYPLLFEVGVDIRQWGAHQGSNMQHSLATRYQQQFSGVGRESSGETPKSAPPTPESSESSTGGGGLLEDDDDDTGGITDNDVLVQLNSEALQTLNAYAHATAPVQGAISVDPTSIHPRLYTLHQHISRSAGRINHDIVDEAATIVQRLGGGAAVFCKSGKDRTAMHITYKQAQFLSRYQHPNVVPSEEQPVDPLLPATLSAATTLRVYGTRLPICEKNVGQAKYAFNSLQVKFMPEKLRPPLSTLAGFLKGGKVFTGGAIES